MLRDRNTVKQVALYWGCSTDTVYRRIADGTLSCLRIAGMIRITREQVEACETACTGSNSAQTVETISPIRPGTNDAFQLGQEIAGKAWRASLDRAACGSDAVLARARAIGAQRKRDGSENEEGSHG